MKGKERTDSDRGKVIQEELWLIQYLWQWRDTDD